jgi:hypothetical protein
MAISYCIVDYAANKLGDKKNKIDRGGYEYNIGNVDRIGNRGCGRVCGLGVNEWLTRY